MGLKYNIGCEEFKGRMQLIYPCHNYSNNVEMEDVL